ncbi:MAG: LLM class flavin-dependent oxidoreductase [Gaiellaceae bacterium]
MSIDLRTSRNLGRVGLVLAAGTAPETVGAAAREAERRGFDELWIGEDFFYGGAISMAGIALASTERLPVGIGVVSPLTRHPALLAMELATLAGAYPGRLLPALGLGAPGWLEQMGLTPPSGLAVMREGVSALRRLLAGEELTERASRFSFQGVRLEYPPETPLELRVGVIGPRMLRLAGALGDGVVLALPSTTGYVRWAREQVEAGASDAGGARRSVTAFALLVLDEDATSARELARDVLAPHLALAAPNAVTEVAGATAEIQRLLAAGGVGELARSLPAAWLDEFAVVGDPDRCRSGIEALFEAGADAVMLLPAPADRAAFIIELLAGRVLPALRRRAWAEPGPIWNARGGLRRRFNVARPGSGPTG